MAGQVKPIPDGFNTLTPHIVVDDARAAFAFYSKALGAELVHQMESPDGKICYAQMKVGDSSLMLVEESPQWHMKSPKSLGGTPVTIHLYVNDADTALQRAEQAGATITMPVQDMFWGDRFGKFADPFGHDWSVATHVEDVAPEELSKRAEAMFAKGACS